MSHTVRLSPGVSDAALSSSEESTAALRRVRGDGCIGTPVVAGAPAGAVSPVCTGDVTGAGEPLVVESCSSGPLSMNKGSYGLGNSSARSSGSLSHIIRWW